MVISKEDQINNISKSVFVTNFPDHIHDRDLWGLCKVYGSVVDVYILFKKSKAGKRFAFIRFIRISNMEHLIENLCTIWIGSFHLYANMVRFNREPKQNGSFSKNTTIHKNSKVPGSFSTDVGKPSGSFASILNNGGSQQPRDSSLALVLDDTCLKEYAFSNSLMCQVKDVTVIPNLYIILAEEVFQSTSICYLGGLWVLIKFDTGDVIEKFRIHVGISSWFTSIKPPSNTFVPNERIVWISIEGLPINAWTNNTFSKIAQKWGELIVWEDSEEKYLSRKHLCLKTKAHVIINESFKVIIKGVVYWIRAKELDAWVPKFANEIDSSSSEDEYSNEETKSDKDEETDSKKEGIEEDHVYSTNDIPANGTSNEYVSKTHDMQNMEPSKGKEAHVPIRDKSLPSDPFNIYPLLQKKDNNNIYSKDFGPTFPPGFTPENASLNNDEGSNSVNNNQNSSVRKKSASNFNAVPSATHMTRTGGSLLDAMDDLVKIGQTMGFNMDGCLKNLEEIISGQGDTSVKR
ncbi:RNA-directed DNA polymerase, eukaryota, nucleotide-binding alpha-beta plait domain protein [Tanacetum coccineum]